MAISYVGGAEASAQGNQTTSVNIGALTGGSDSAPSAGDLIIAAFGVGDDDNTDNNIAAPTLTGVTFTEVADLNVTASGDDVDFAVFYGYYSGSDTTLDWSGVGGTDAANVSVVMVFRGVRAAADGGPFDVAATTTAVDGLGNPNPPSINHSNASGIWIVIAAATSHLGGAGATYTFPTGYTTDAIDRSHDDTNDVIVGMGYRNSGVSDPEDPGTITFSAEAGSNSYAAVTMALREAVVALVIADGAHAHSADNIVLDPEGLEVTDRGFAAQTADLTSYAFGSFSPVANRWLIIDVINTVSSGTPNTPTLSGGGLTYTQEATVLGGGGSAALARITRFTAWTGESPGTFSITADLSSQTQVGCSMHVGEVAGADESDPIVQTATNNSSGGSGTTASATLAAYGSANNRPYVTAMNGTPAITPEAGYTELRETTGHANYNAETEWHATATDTSPSASWTGDSHWAIVTSELRKAGGPVSLVIADATHAHAADNLALTQHNVLAIQDATHGHTADNVVLGINLVIADAVHSHTADNLALTQHHVLAIADATHGHTSENQALTQHNVLAVQDALHAHAADNLALTQHNVLAVADAAHAHAADNLVLTAHEPGADALEIQDAAHAHAAEALVLGVGLVIADAAHTHSADNLVLTQHNILVIADALHAHLADNLGLSVEGEDTEQNVVRLRRRKPPIGTG